MEVLQADGAVKYILHYDNEGQDVIIVITENMVIGQFQVDPSDGSLVEVTKIKVSTRSKDNQAAWAGPVNNAIFSLFFFLVGTPLFKRVRNPLMSSFNYR